MERFELEPRHTFVGLGAAAGRLTVADHAPLLTLFPVCVSE